MVQNSNNVFFDNRIALQSATAPSAFKSSIKKQQDANETNVENEKKEKKKDNEENIAKQIQQWKTYHAHSHTHSLKFFLMQFVCIHNNDQVKRNTACTTNSSSSKLPLTLA